MQTGSVVVARPRAVALDRLRMILAGSNCEILEATDSRFRFRHGTYLTQTASLFPKTRTLQFVDRGDTTVVHYEVATAPFMVVWLTIVGVLFCWLIFPAILAHRALVYHPRRFVENLLAGI